MVPMHHDVFLETVPFHTTDAVGLNLWPKARWLNFFKEKKGRGKDEKRKAKAGHLKSLRLPCTFSGLCGSGGPIAVSYQKSKSTLLDKACE